MDKRIEKELEKMGYNAAAIPEEKAKLIEWALDDKRTEKQLDTLLLFLKAMKKGDK